MPISDKKKCQTLINVCAEAAEQLQLLSSKLSAYKSIYQSENISPVGTLLNGNVMTISAWIDDVATVAEDSVVNDLISWKMPTHRNKALEI